MKTLLTGRGLVESPRWHGDRLYFSDWSAGEVLAVELGGQSEVIARVESVPLCTGWLPDGRLVIVSSPEGRLLRREPDGSVVTHADLGGVRVASGKFWSDIPELHKRRRSSGSPRCPQRWPMNPEANGQGQGRRGQRSST